MVQALVRLNDDTNRVLNVVKAKQGFKDKAEAIEFVVQRYAELEEPELNPKFIAKMKKADKQKSIKANSLSERYGLKRHVPS